MVTRNPDETREKILQAAFEEIHRCGFRSASVDDILTNTGLTKGALYHHFPNKAALGYAVVDDIIRREMDKVWIQPIDEAENPLDGLRNACEAVSPESIQMVCSMGCPLNNLAQEMSPIDEEFRRRIEAVYEAWREALAARLERGKAAGHVRSDLDSDQAAIFLIAAIEGASGLAKNSQNPDVLLACMAGVLQYIESMRPVGATVSA